MNYAKEAAKLGVVLLVALGLRSWIERHGDSWWGLLLLRDNNGGRKP